MSSHGGLRPLALFGSAATAALLVSSTLFAGDEPAPTPTPAPPTVGPERPKIRRWLDDPNAPSAPPAETQQPLSPDSAPRSLETPEPEPLVRTKPSVDTEDPDVAARRATMRSAIRSKLDDAEHAYDSHDYQRAEAIARNVLQADPRNTCAAEIIGKARRKLIEKDEQIADVAGDTRDHELILEAQEHGIAPPARIPTVRPHLQRRDEDPETARRKKMSERLDEHIKSMDFMKADLDWVFNTLFILTGVNIIADPKALDDKTLTIHVDDIPLRAVLDFIVRNNKDITYSVTEDAIFITANTADDQKSLMYPKVYSLHHGLVSTEENQGGQGAGATAGGASGGGVGTAANGGRLGGGGAGGGGGQKKQQGGGGQGNQKERSYLESVLAWMKKDNKVLPDGSEYMVDDQSNQLIVFTTPAGHDRVAKFLDYFDQPAIQVLIKVRVLELSAENEKSIGFNLDNLMTRGVSLSTTSPAVSTGTGVATGTNTSVSTGVNTGVATGTSTGVSRNPFHAYSAKGGATSFLPGNLGPGTVAQFVGLRTDPQFQITLSLLLNSRFTKVLSEPQVLAINNKAATIGVTTQFNYITNLQPLQQNIVTGIGTQVPNVSAYIPQFGQDSVGFRLDVTPSVGRDLKTINLHVHPYIDALAEGQNIQQFQTFNITGANNGAQQPAIQQPTKDQTELETDVVIEDNGYVVLGGLIRTRREIQKREVPGFSKIPLLGNLFKSTSVDVTKDNLVIIVEAQIITPTGRTYYKDPAPDDVNPREGGSIHAPMQTADGKYSTAEQMQLALDREPSPEKAEKPDEQPPEPRHRKQQPYSKPATAAQKDAPEIPYSEQAGVRPTPRELMERTARAARVNASLKPRASTTGWAVPAEEGGDAETTNAAPPPAAPDKPQSKGEVVGSEKE
jgi:type II secretory pathway component GspD/PulD (secretin)